LFGAAYAPAQTPATPSANDAGFARRVTEFVLPNGLHFIVIERHEAPTVSFHIYVRAGSASVPAGQSGLVRLLERLAWSGTEAVGTRDGALEKQALDAVEEAQDRLQAERNKGPKADEVKISSLEFDVKRAIDRAQSFAKPGGYQQELTDQGASGMSASGSADAIQYACTLPSNRAELWFSLESQRLARPVLRGFYTERDELAQQLRTRPADARVAEGLASAAFPAHPYRNPIHGWTGDLESLRTADARSFIERYFVPGNLTIAIAGDIAPAEARRLADRYFGVAAWNARPLPAAVPTVDPVQNAPRAQISYSATTPIVAVGYRRPNLLDRDDAVFDAIQAILSGANGWLAQSLTQESGIAVAARAQATYPGGRYPALFAITAQPAPGRTLEQTVAAVQALVDRLRVQPIDEATLARAKAHVRESILAVLAQNAGAAAMLAASAAEYGDWQAPFAELDRMQKLSAPEVQRVAAKYFAPERRTAAYSGLEPAPAAVPAAGGVK
jgi:predicted Zn-dependent peptidase